MIRAIKATLYTGALFSVILAVLYLAVKYPHYFLGGILGLVLVYVITRIWYEFYENS